MRFVKMQGLGNDFIIMDDMQQSLSITPDMAREICHRRLGVGADGLMLVRPSKEADVTMFLYNSDGSVAEMCGNGIRCFAKYVYDSGIVKKTDFAVETLAGIKIIHLTLEDGEVAGVRVNMGSPAFDKADIPMIGEGECRLEQIAVLGRKFTCSAANTGVPHLVVYVDDISEEDILKYGAALETHPLFPAKINVNFAQIKGKDRITVRTWERGCGRTFACGTGSCAAAVCAARDSYTNKNATVELAFGELYIEWAQDGSIYMTGPAKTVYEGEI